MHLIEEDVSSFLSSYKDLQLDKKYKLLIINKLKDLVRKNGVLYVIKDIIWILSQYRSVSHVKIQNV